MKWEELPLADRALLMAAAVRNGYTDIRSIKAAYANFQNQRQQTGNRYDEGGDIDNDNVEVVNVLDEHPVWKALGNIDYETVADPEFTREKTGAGSIEYFSAEEPEGITYNNGYHREHPMPGKDVILYNPDENDELDIRLDALHIMPKDPTYDTLNLLYREAARDSDVAWAAEQRYKEDVAKYGKEALDKAGMTPLTYFNNEADAFLRNMFIEGTPEYIESRRYLPNKQQLAEWNQHLMPYVNNIQQYLETGQRPDWLLPELTVTNQKAYGGNLFKTGGNKGKKKGITQQELQRRKDYYRQQLIIRGLRGAQLEAVLANMEVESGFNPDNVNPYSGAKGLMQWLGSRKPKSWSEKDQLDYIAATYNKFGGNEWLDKAAWKRFNETTDPAEAARLFRRYWERPERSSWNATDALFKNSKGSYLPKEVNDLVAQVSNLLYDEPKAPVFTEEDQRLLDTPALAFYNPEYEDPQAPDHKPSALQKSIKLDESLWRDPANNWDLYNQFANMQQGSPQDNSDWFSTLVALSPKTTHEQKEAANWLFNMTGDGGQLYHGLNFAAYGGKVNKFDDGGFSDLPEQRAYRRAVNLKAPYTNYEDAIDMDDSIMLRLKKFFDKGVSNCTLTASQILDPNTPVGRARTLVTAPRDYNLYQVDEGHIVPGTMVIASHPNMSDYNPEQNYHTMIVTGFAPNNYEYTFRDGTKYQIKKGEPLVSYSRGKASADNYVHNIPLSVYNAKSEGKTYNRYYRPIDENYPQVMLGGSDGIEVVANKNANGGNLFYKGGLEDQFANTYLGIGQFPDYDSDFITANNLQYLPYSQLNMIGHDPENIRIANQGNQTMHAYNDKDATYLADANGNLVTSPLLRQMTQDYVKEHYGPMLLKAFLSNPDKYWDEYNKYRTSSVTFDENGNPISSGLPPVEKPIEPVAPEFWLLSAGASKAPSTLNSVISPLFNMVAVDNAIDDVTPYSGWGNMMSQNAGGPEWAWDLAHPAFAKDIWNLTKAAGKYIYNKIGQGNIELTPSNIENIAVSTSEKPFYRDDADIDWSKILLGARDKMYKEYDFNKTPLTEEQNIKRPIDFTKLTEGNLNKRLKLSISSPGVLLKSPSIEEITAELAEYLYGPSGKYWKNIYDIAKNHNFSGKYREMANTAEQKMAETFSISKDDFDIAQALEKARRIYTIPEYRQRFEKFGTLGDTFVEDANIRLDNSMIEGLSKDALIKGQFGVSGDGFTQISANGNPVIGIKDYDDSKLILSIMQHEFNHASHGMAHQPKWMELHNEAIRPIPKKEATSAIHHYFEDMNEIVARAKTLVEFADRNRIAGENLDDAIARIIDNVENGADRFSNEIPEDIHQLVRHFTQESLTNFALKFVGGLTGVGVAGAGMSTNQ